MRTGYTGGLKRTLAKLIEALQPRNNKLAELMPRAEGDVLAYKNFPQNHWRQIHSTNPFERLHKEIKRRTNVVGIFPNDASTRRLVGALMLEQNDEWAVTRRYMALEIVAAICEEKPSTRQRSPPSKPAQHSAREQYNHAEGHYHSDHIRRSPSLICER